MDNSPKLICVTGPDGSGKTTQITKLAERLERRGKKRVVAVTIWDLLLDPSSKGKISFKSPVEVDAYLEILHPTSRALFLYHCFYQALELAKKRAPDVCLLNAYWYKYYATEVAHGGDSEPLLRLADIFPEPEITFYLKIDPEEAFRRKVRLSGYETGFSQPRSREAFVAFQHKAHRTLERLAQEREWRLLNGREPIDALTDTLLNHIDQEVSAC
jgi:thymidylate kinase